jgi:hypothetical protein
MSGLNNLLKISGAALAMAFALAGAAYADGPTACSTYKPVADSKVIGKKWSLTQRDDGQDWAKSTWVLAFTADGKWSSDGAAAGSWCQTGDMIIFGFDDAPHTVYRGQVGASSASGIEAWDGAGTGIFEMTVVK